MRSIARFVVDTHCHITTLYQPLGEESQKLYDEGRWTGLNGNIVHFDDSDFTVRDMDRYGVDKAILLPSMLGCTNEAQLDIMNKYPGRFGSCACDGQTLMKYYKDRSSQYNFQEGLDEVEAALKTGRFTGIGEFAPGMNAALYDLYDHDFTMEERYDQWRGLCDLAVKYDVPIHYHDFLLGMRCKGWTKWNHNEHLGTIIAQNPKAKILVSHGYKDPFAKPDTESFNAEWKDFYQMAAQTKTMYLECGGWCEKNFQLAFDNGMTAARIMWGHDYGNVPQYLMRRDTEKKLKTRSSEMPRNIEIWNHRGIDSVFGGGYEGFPPVPTYQSDFYGWGMRIMDRVGDWITQDEINLMMGGTAARVYKLQVPCSRLFPEARPDIFGENWKEEWYPFIPDSQIMNPDRDADGNIYRLPTDC